MAYPAILLAEDHEIVRLGTTMLIKQLYPQAIVTEASTLKMVMQHVTGNFYDLLILDINIPGGDSVQMIDRIRQCQPAIPILVLSSYEEDIYALRFLKAGADGYLQKDTDKEIIKRAIEKVLAREMYISPIVHRQLLYNYSPAKQSLRSSPFNQLTSRERQITRLLVKGMTSSQISHQLNLQLSTISTHKAHIFDKMGVRNLVELVDTVRSFRQEHPDHLNIDDME